ncbi:unnamed protein product [Microthlaspi erraticum]|uniref:Protein kinase domain-containing protein n=1 Tax=Microthlaspi erraticum TaxID=1685480 RepID=A0A6D2HPZ5_9BRAS|nr:unnamed protein product [Microthlaspi erraticum]
MNARLGDFGLAKLYDQGFDPQTSKVAGTFGYIAPEFLRTGRATTSTDVYALGWLCLKPAMSSVMRILNGDSQLPDNLLDVVRDEKLRGWPETSMELLFDVNSLGSTTFTDSLVSHGR